VKVDPVRIVLVLSKNIAPPLRAALFEKVEPKSENEVQDESLNILP
jgi:hypothetical protein